LIVKKFLTRGSKTIAQLAQENGVGVNAFYNWTRIYGRTAEMKPLARSPQDWSSEEKFKAVMKFDSLPEEERGAFLRSEGVHSDHIAQWRQKMQLALEPEKPDARTERGELTYRILDLERDLARKEKALAEAAGLLILKKKADLIWGTEGEK
jgi:transposase-like protein